MHEDYLNSNDKTDVEQISTPLPAMAVNIPPIVPVPKRTNACQNPKSGIASNVFRLCCLRSIFGLNTFVKYIQISHPYKK